MIACPHCRHPHSIVLETREHRAGLYRRRQCVECGERFTTLETTYAARRGRPPGGGGTTLPAPTPERRTGAHRSKQK